MTAQSLIADSASHVFKFRANNTKPRKLFPGFGISFFFNKMGFVIVIEKEEKQKRISIAEWEQISGTTFLSAIQFETDSVREKIRKKIEKLYQKGELTRQQLWFGSYFKKEMGSLFIPDVVIRYISPILGWGLFAARDFAKMEFIAEYSGIVRKSRRSDKTNAYCFEYTLANGVKTPYTIDAETYGGIGRMINHNQNSNLQSSLATTNFLNHIILITSKPIKKGEQLCYDYGPDYWAHREKPIDI